MSPYRFETIWLAEQRVRDGECMFSAETEQKESVLVAVFNAFFADDIFPQVMVSTNSRVEVAEKHGVCLLEEQSK